MKICPICEKKIESRWCGHCFRFVDPWILPDDVYINERHSDHESGHCEYHNPGVEYDKQEYMKPGYENKIYGSNKKPAPKLHIAGRDKKQSTRSKKSLIFVVVIVFIYYFINGIVSVLKTYETSETTKVMEESEAYEYNYDSEYAFLDVMEPVSSEVSGQFTYEVYSTEDICAGGVECSREHMDYYLDEYISILNELKEYESAITTDFEKLPGECNNYVARTQDGRIEDAFWEDTYNSTTAFGGITLAVDAATLRLHDIYIYSMSESDDFARAAYEIISSLDDSVFESVDEFKSEIEDVKKDTGYVFLLEGDYEYGLYTTTDGYISLTINPY